MNSTASTESRPVSSRFTAGNRGGPGNPFARQTAALRAYLINHVTERDIQDILDILLLNAKGGHLPTIKFLFSYVLGKPKPVVEPDLLDLQEMQMMQQSALPPEALAALCDQLPLDLQVQVARSVQRENVTATVQTAQTARGNAPAATAPQPTRPSRMPSANDDDEESRGLATAAGPSTNGDFKASSVGRRKKAPSPNGEKRRPDQVVGFDWLDELRRACGGQAPT